MCFALIWRLREFLSLNTRESRTSPPFQIYFFICVQLQITHHQIQIGQILPSACSQKQNWQRQPRELRGPVEQDDRRSSDGVLIFGAGTAGYLVSFEQIAEPNMS